MGELEAGLAQIGFAPVAVVPLAGDASQRRFFRVVRADGTTVVAALYPAANAGQAERDFAVQEWSWRRGLPIPRPLARRGALVVAEDVGDLDLERALTAGQGEAVGLALANLAAFQACVWDDLPTPPFDAAFFRRELAVFEEFALQPGGRGRREIAAFLDGLAARAASHPYRLVHRDFHVNNLFLHAGTVWAVDFQDMRGGPDTYDLVSLLRERAGADLIASESSWKQRAAAEFSWQAGWQGRYQECAAQRGLKVIGTFVRLASRGRTSYLAWLPAVGRRTLEALSELQAPVALADAVRAVAPGL
jgi:aminoglycoside/choline kinase family phosphotransferase